MAPQKRAFHRRAPAREFVFVQSEFYTTRRHVRSRWLRSAAGHRRHHSQSLGSRVRESAAGVFLWDQWPAGTEGRLEESVARSDRVCEYQSCRGERSSQLDSRGGPRGAAAARRLSPHEATVPRNREGQATFDCPNRVHCCSICAHGRWHVSSITSSSSHAAPSAEVAARQICRIALLQPGLATLTAAAREAVRGPWTVSSPGGRAPQH